MFFTKLSTLFSVLSLTGSSAPVEQDGVKQIAIIGAGPGGSTTAYYLRKFAEESGFDVNITIFEKTARIGGRTLTAHPYDIPEETVELGASIFVDANHILVNATRDFDLPIKEPETESREVLGIWNGDEFVFTQSDSSPDWWNLARLFWKYGLSPYRADKLVKKAVSTFLQLYEAPHFPFKSLTESALQLGLVNLTSQTGTQILNKNGILDPFARDIVQAATRVNYASNLQHIHGLEALVSLAPDGAKQVKGGNWQIFSNMITKSNSTVFQNTTVSSISLKNQTAPIAAHKYLISTKSHLLPTINEETSEEILPLDDQYPVAFDNVVIAAPWQFADIKAGPEVLQQSIEEIEYTRLHVTLFCSPLQLSPAYFNLPPGSKAPDSVLTTLGPDETPQEGPAEVGKAGFFSVSTLRTITNPNTQKEEYIYKIFSAEKVTAGFLSKLLGAPVPDTFVVPHVEAEEGKDSVSGPVSWYSPNVFDSYPVMHTRSTFQDPALGNGVYYVSGVESFVSAMEASAMMGRNIAGLIANDIVREVEDKQAEEKAAEEANKAAQEKEQKKKPVAPIQQVLVGDDMVEEL